MLFNLLTEGITIVEKENYKDYIEEAKNLIEKIDKDDVPFLAFALSTVNDGIWSDDVHFKQQDKVKVWTTENVLKKIRINHENE